MNKVTDSSYSRSKHIVLVVEDAPEDAALIRARLKDLPSEAFEVVEVSSLAEALLALTAVRADAIILDLNLSDSRGLATLNRIKPKARTAPIIVVSGTLDEDLTRQVLELGADDALEKSVIDSQLFSRSILYVVERNRAREQHGHVESLLDATPDAIVVVNEHGVVRYLNRSAQTLFGRTVDDFVGERLGFSVKSGAVSEIVVPRNGDDRICEMRVVDFDWRDERGYLATIRDMTQQRKLDTRLMMTDRLISLGTLAAGVAHEINNPLAAVLTNLSLALEDAPEDPALRAELSDAQEAAMQIRHVVRDIGLFSRSEEDEHVPFDVHHALDTIVRMSKNQVRSKARLVKDYGEVRRVLGNESRLSQVFLNILVNAAQAITGGNVAANEIRISTRVAEDGRVTIRFSDTGSGITPAVHRRIFTPFFTTKPVGTGTGLGLAISQQIVNAHGGEIWVESEVGRGSSFTVALPAAEGDAETVLRHAPLLPPPYRGRILIIDDDPVIGRGIQRALRYDHEVTFQQRAIEALDLIRQGQLFDVILCDMMMPEVDGMQFALALEQLGRGAAEGLVLTSGGATSPQARDFLTSGRYPYLTKPFDLTELRQLIRRCIDAQRSRSSLPPRSSGIMLSAPAAETDDASGFGKST